MDTHRRQKESTQDILDRFEAYVKSRANTIFARYKFHQRIQGEGESCDLFVTELRLLVKYCDFPNSDEMIRDRIVFGTNSPKVHEKLLCHTDLTLEKAIDIAQTHELSQQQLKTMHSPTASTANQSAHAVSRKPFKSEHTRYGRTTNWTDSKNTVWNKECGACGGEHGRTEESPAKVRQCKCAGHKHSNQRQSTSPRECMLSATARSSHQMNCILTLSQSDMLTMPKNRHMQRCK